MATSKNKVLTSIHGNEVGLNSDDQLLVHGNVVPTWNESGTALVDPNTGVDVGGGGGLATGRSIASGTTLVIADAGTILEFTGGSNANIVIPADVNVNFPIDTVIGIYQSGAGIPTFTGAAPPTLRTPTAYVTSVQYAHTFIRKVAANTWAYC